MSTKTIDLLLEELKEDKFRGERGGVNHPELLRDCLSLFEGVEEDGVVGVKVDEYGRKEEAGSQVTAILLYQNLLLLQRVVTLESKLGD